MTITYELDLNSFQAWSGAKDTLDRIQREGKCGLLEQILEDTYPDGMTETELFINILRIFKKLVEKYGI